MTKRVSKDKIRSLNKSR